MMVGALKGNSLNNSWFTRAYYLLAFVFWLSLYPVIELSIGAESLQYRNSPSPSLINNIVFSMNYFPAYHWPIYIMVLLGALASVFQIGGVIIRGAFWICQLILLLSSYDAFNGGLYLASLWAFFLVFSFPKARENWLIEVRNFSFIAIRIQFLLGYFFSGYYKWISQDWLEGNAIRMLSFNDLYTPDWLAQIYLSFPLIGEGLTYLIMTYLLIFPVVVFVKRIKSLFILIGVSFHLYTAFIMGLADFGLIMIAGYILFLDKSYLTGIKEKTEVFLGYFIQR